jgi:hypothetical protein
MGIAKQVRVRTAATAVLAVLGAQVVALADDKPAGETWKQTMSMEMPGMNMPPRTLEICVPAGKAKETLSKPQGPGMGSNCTMEDAKQDGNKFTARMVCTGQRPVEGTVEMIFEANHAKTTVAMSMNGQQVTMKMDSEKVGTPCTLKALPGAK